MKPIVRKLILGGAAGILIVVAGAFSTVQIRWDRKFNAPETALVASPDPAVIERGRWLAYGPAGCAYCHTPAAMKPRLEAGEQIPLSGGHDFPLPFGSVHTPNLTPDPETGIGRRTDADLVNILRHGIRADGRVAIPFMEYQMMSDEDLIAVISFLRSQPPVNNPVPDHRYNLMGKALLAFLIKPMPAEGQPPKSSPTGPTLERGKYLTEVIAHCAACHTERNMKDGSFMKPKFSGGGVFEIPGDPDHVFVSPNLTPDPRTGVMTSWTEDDFIARFRAGKKIQNTEMPWAAFQRSLSDDDLRAIFRYIRTQPPVENNTGPVLQDKPKKS